MQEKRKKMESYLSSWLIIVWNPRHVSFLQGSVDCSDQLVDVRSHFSSVRVILELTKTRPLEVAVLLALDTEQTVLRNFQTQKLDHSLEL